jgi:hypothetical protein
MINWAMIYCDRKYQRDRDRLIPQAVKIADEQSGVKRGQKITQKERERRIAHWNFLYHSKMNELYNKGKENGNGKRNDGL